MGGGGALEEETESGLVERENASTSMMRNDHPRPFRFLFPRQRYQMFPDTGGHHHRERSARTFGQNVRRCGTVLPEGALLLRRKSDDPIDAGVQVDNASNLPKPAMTSFPSFL